MEESFRWILIKITAERSRHSALDNSAVKLLGYAGLALSFCTSYTELIKIKPLLVQQRARLCGWLSSGLTFSGRRSVLSARRLCGVLHLF